MRTYIKSGYAQSNLTDTNENYIINNFQNQPGKMGIEYNDMNFKIETESNKNNLKEELKNIFFTLIVTDKKNEYLQVKNITIKPCKAKEKLRIIKTELLNNQIERFQL